MKVYEAKYQVGDVVRMKFAPHMTKMQVRGVLFTCQSQPEYVCRRQDSQTITVAEEELVEDDEA